MPVTPRAGDASIVTTGGTPVVAAAANPLGYNGGFITNPYLATDQGLAVAEPLLVDPVGNASLIANGTTFALQPGQTWEFPPGQTTPTTVNAVSDGHKFSIVVF